MNRRGFLKRSILAGIALLLDPMRLLPKSSLIVGTGRIKWDAGYVYAPYIPQIRNSAVRGKEG